MSKKILLLILVLCIAVGWLSRPISGEYDLSGLAEPDPANGELVLHAGGCRSCHGQNLAGGEKKGFSAGILQGQFQAPNITPDVQTGLGGWSTLDFLRAMKDGVSPGGKHYYPAFPYTSYARISVADLVDLKAYLDTVPAVNQTVDGQQLPFPWNIRRGIGLWKLLYFNTDWVNDGVGMDAAWQRGRYLAEGAGHCAECHTPRNALGALQTSHWMSGAADPEGQGRVPDITSSADGLRDWSESDIRYYLESGFTPDFDTAGGVMVEVQENIARLPQQDIAAIARYIKSLNSTENAGE